MTLCLAASVAAIGVAPAAGATEPDGEDRGIEWVRHNPMVVTALVVSLPAPPGAERADFLGEFGANTVLLWKDGPGYVAGWQTEGADSPFVTWLDDDGTSVQWNGTGFESTGIVLGGLGADHPGRIGFQVGDEPLSVAQLQAIAAGTAAVRNADPNALLLVNFTYHVTNRADLLDYWVTGVDADVQISTDYEWGPLHYLPLEQFRETGLEKGVPYWQYLNAYIGDESGRERAHTVSDLRWQAMAGLAYGYTGHLWFFYQSAADGHPSATRHGGSALHDGVGSWTAPRTPSWQAVAGINRELAHLGPTITQLTSTDVRVIAADDPRAGQPLGTRTWTPGAGGDPYLTALSPAPGEGPMEIVAGFFTAVDGAQYTVLQNARHTHSLGPVAAPLPNAEDAGRIHMTFDFTGAPAHIDRSRIEYLDPADGRVRALALDVQEPPPPPPPPDPPEDPPEDPEEPPPPPPPPVEISTAQVTLPAGGVLLFKYADTFPFRRGPHPEGVGLVDVTTGRWHLRERSGVTSFTYGNPGDVPFVGDWDCDGVATPGLYRPADGFVYLRNSNDTGVADITFFAGNPNDTPLAGDFDGDGCDTVSLYRSDEATMYVFNRLGSGSAGLGRADLAYVFGNPGDTAFSGDFDGDGITTLGLRREDTGFVYLSNSHRPAPADATFFYGDPGDTVQFGDWDGDGTATPGVFRRADARFYLRFANEFGPADLDFAFGEAGWMPVAGEFS